MPHITVLRPPLVDTAGSFNAPPAHRRYTPRVASVGVALGFALVLGACSSTRVAPPAPVEDRTPTPASVAAVPASPPPGSENAGKPGYRTVRPGDSLIRIGLETGQNWRDLARWNALDNPNRLEVGQVLRVVPPDAPEAAPAAEPSAAAPAAASGVAVAPVTTTPAVVGKPLPAANSSAAPGTSAGTTAKPAASAAPAAESPSAAKSQADAQAMGFVWPTDGQVIAEFDGKKNNGIDIAGKAGQPVVAAADAQVLYVGSMIRGMGNLVILKHANNFLTAYAHNQAIVVKENQLVKKGQKIAEMGSSDTDRPKLHFELRRLTAVLDPLKALPPR